ncbi:MAG: hypothetical protein JRJ49_02075 [Deltaproteobacteria bacterium]|nr:hypothetical protein [Deltaproteobacteria bacterium]
MKKIAFFLITILLIGFSSSLYAQENTNPKDEQVYSVLGTLYNWKSSWEGKNLDQYISFYHPMKKFAGLPIDKFKERKKYIFKKAGKIALSISDLCVKEKQGKIITEFTQYYNVKNRLDIGKKKLTWAKSGKKWQIISEQFTAMKNKENIKSSFIGVKTLEKNKKEIFVLKISEANFKRLKMRQSVGTTFKFIIDFPQSYKFAPQAPSIVHLKSSLIEGAVIYKYENCYLKRGVIFLTPNKDYKIAGSYDKGFAVFLIQN